jgi:hypothetical protein
MINKKVFTIVCFVLALCIFIKGFFYNIYPEDFIKYFDNQLKFFPLGEKLLFYLFLPFAYLFVLPQRFFIVNFFYFNNLFIQFLIDILLTIFELAFFYLLIKKLMKKK